MLKCTFFVAVTTIFKNMYTDYLSVEFIDLKMHILHLENGERKGVNLGRDGDTGQI